MSNWSDCRNILCIRLDNMGDLLMSEPAIRALKHTFNCNVTVLTSRAGKNMAKFISAIDDTIVYDSPWVKSSSLYNEGSFFTMADLLKSKQFDAAVIFTVFSQTPLPAAMLSWLAHIPRRLAYCRENPYALLTHWIPEQEPYSFIRHQVRRDLELVRTIGASVTDDRLKINLPEGKRASVLQKLSAIGLDISRPWLLLHPGVSEEKRKYPLQGWIETGRKIVKELNHQVVLTGSADERSLTGTIASSIGSEAFSCAGLFSLEEFIELIAEAALVISVNTSTIHIAAAMQTRIIVLYALTNPQHAPWKTVGKVLPFSVPLPLQSKNEIVQYVQREYFNIPVTPPLPDKIISEAQKLLTGSDHDPVPEIIRSSTPVFQPAFTD